MDDNARNELRNIRIRVESIEKTQELLVRAEAERILGSIMPSFETDRTLRQVYLAVDGLRGQRQIVDQLSPAASEATVSRKLEALREMDLVELVDRTSAGKIYARTGVDRILRIARRVQRLEDGTS